MSRNALVGALIAAAALVALFLYLSGDREGRPPRPEESGVSSAPALDEAGGDARGAAQSATSGTEVETESPPPVSDPESPPLLVGRVVGEGAGIPDARVLFFPVEGVEDLLRRFQDLGGEFSGELPDVGQVIARVKSELARFRGTALATRTDENGDFELRDAPPGGYLVLTLADRWLFRYGDVVSLSPERTEELELALERGATIAGRVVSPSGAGIGGVKVIAEYRPAGMPGVGRIVRKLLKYVNGEFLKGPFEVTSDEDGTFEIASLPPGNYDLTAYDSRGLESTTENVETGTLNAVVFFGDGAEISGLVITPDGFPVPELTIQLEPTARLVQLPLPVAAFSEVANTLNRFLGEGPRTAVSGRDGSFRFHPIGAGAYRMTIEQPGFLPLQRDVNAQWGESVDLGQIPVSAGNSIRGVVRAESGRPLENAVVVAFPSEPGMFAMGSAFRDFMTGRVRTRSGRNGEFELRGLGRGPFQVNATRRGYAPKTADNVAPGEEPVELLLEPGRTLTGRVVIAGTGEPLGGARVRVGEARTTTDANGEFILEGVLSSENSLNFNFGMGMAQARVEQEGREEEPLQARASAKGFLPDRQEILFSRLPQEVRFELTPAPSIEGVVFDPQGAAAPGALVRLAPDIPSEVGRMFGFDTGLIFLAVTVADLDGRFRFEDVHVGGGNEFVILADHLEFSRGRSEPFTLDELLASPRDLVVQLIRGARISGLVTDGNQPVPGAIVRLSSNPEDEDARQEGMMMRMMGLPRGGQVVHTDSEGRFAYERIEPGAYEVSAEKVGFTEAPEESVIVAEGDSREFRFVLDPGQTLRGVVVDDQGVAISRARVRLLRRDVADEQMLVAQRLMGGAYKSAVTEEDGTFAIPGLPTTGFTLVAEKTGYTAAVVEEVWPGTSGDPRLVLVPSAALTVVVTDAASGRPIPGFRVRVKDNEEAQAFMMIGDREVNDPDGIFTQGDLEAKSYEVRVRAPGYQPSSRSVQLYAGRATEEIFTLAAAGRIRGRVVEAGRGRPVAGARVSLAPPRTTTQPADDEAALRSFVEGSVLADQTTTDDGGRFLLDTVPEGPQTLVVRHDDFITSTRPVTAFPGEEIEVEIRLASGLVVEGRVENQAGTPEQRFLLLRGDGPDNQSIQKSLVSAPDGSFRFAGLAPGSYRVVVPAQGGIATSVALELEEDREDLRIVVSDD